MVLLVWQALSFGCRGPTPIRLRQCRHRRALSAPNGGHRSGFAYRQQRWRYRHRRAWRPLDGDDFWLRRVQSYGEELAFDPVLPERWQALTFRIQWRGRLIHIRIDRRREVLAATLERGEPVALRVNGDKLVLESGCCAESSYTRADRFSA
jgi:hypothetical protein